jgi:ABC-2 type transport system ATP-binding protein
MEEAERLCDRLVIIDRGKVIADDTLQGLHRMLPSATVLTVELHDAQTDRLRLAENLQSVPGVESVELRNGSMRIGLHDLSADSPVVLHWLGEHGHRVQHLASERVTLETMFLTLTGRNLRD